ncbi:flagellar hook-length control protein FliK [Methylobrevis sp. L22]|uniref:Flagellar hook-length control protein FliK n=2 Tax=Methylobrevis albus TaxID=2793297 RepID=A0A931HZ38_9HYPH|nr:flagellar hook-length control protein FliK [Methylobrevis albus]
MPGDDAKQVLERPFFDAKSGGELVQRPVVDAAGVAPAGPAKAGLPETAAAAAADAPIDLAGVTTIRGRTAADTDAAAPPAPVARPEASPAVAAQAAATPIQPQLAAALAAAARLVPPASGQAAPPPDDAGAAPETALQPATSQPATGQPGSGQPSAIAAAIAAAAAGPTATTGQRAAGVSAAAAAFADRMTALVADDLATDDAGDAGDGDGGDAFLAALGGNTGSAATQTAGLATGLPHGASAAAHAAAAAALGRQIAARAGSGETRFEIRLDPAELGRVDVELEIDSDGTTRAHIAVERRETLDLMLRDQRMLERALREAGLSTGDGGLSFSMRGDQGGDGRSWRDARPAARTPVTTEDETAPAAVVQAAGFYGHRSATRVDIRI